MKLKGFMCVSLVVAILLVFGSACSTGNTKSNESSGSPITSQAPGKDAESESATRPIVTLTVRGADTGPIPGVQNNRVTEVIEEKLGIKIDYQLSDPTKDKVALASGDLPDIMQIPITEMGVYIKGDHIVPLTDLIASNGQEITNNVPKMLEFSKKYLSDNTGLLYGLTANNYVNVGDAAPVYSYPIGLTLRWDYYKEMGYPKINNEDDFLNVLAQMQKLHPTTADGKKVYGISGWNDWGLWPYFVPYVFSQGYLNGNNWTLIDGSSKVTPMFTHEGSAFKNAMKFMYKANQLKLLDPEMFTQKNDNFIAKNKNLQFLSVPATWWNVDALNTMQASGIKEGGYYLIPGANPVVYQGSGSMLTGAISGKAIVISKQSKHQDRAMDLLNFLYSYEGNRLLMSGIEGEHWEMENGRPELKDSEREAMQTEANYVQKTGINLYHNFMGMSTESRDPEGNLLNVLLTDKSLELNATEGDKDYNAQYGVSYPGQAFQKLAEQGKAKIQFYDNTFQSLYPDLSNDLKMINGKIETYTKTWLPKLITAKDEGEFEKIWTNGVDEMNKLGLDTLMDWELQQNIEALDKMKEINQ
ncbi:extracellular solute-binding protein [Paenibacillus sp. PAMC21692]|uniref:extracellular solute-binding protein n=1 Tax=Paenibacillus sp. PAMC21692 TaxID=2762320 RepID=UPI00164D39E6|nr:extracellular solute-binding protein [Paenibacillus sp. PAMC21692]QNK58946.1 extracellular solute-binding protein [Paenibacillus sp. PAMC21692]